MPEPYRRPAFDALLARAREPRRFMQVLAGPRQVGKTTLARQVNGAIDLPAHYASADEPTLQDAAWTRAQGEARRDRELWGRLVESAVGAHLVNTGEVERLEVSYWRERGREVDFVVRAGKALVAIEVKSGRRRDALPGTTAFLQAYPSARPLLVGAEGIDLEEFLSRPAASWVAGA